MAKYIVSQLNKTAGTSAEQISASSILAYEIIIKNISANPCYIGDVNVSSTNGMELGQGEQIIFGERHQWEVDLSEIYAVTSSSTADIRVFYVKRD